MATIDLVFEGGGAKGMVFVGALQELFKPELGHHSGRLLGTSAGAITAVFLAAGYTPAEMEVALTEKDANGKPIFASFLGEPGPWDEQTIRSSALHKLFKEIDLPLVPDAIEEKAEDWLLRQLASRSFGRNLFSFVERGGWYAADPFIAWLRRKLDEGEFQGKPRAFSQLTMAQFFEQTHVNMTLVAADTTSARLLLLNHRTAPDLPIVWAARMSMSVPLLWQEVEWQKEWGDYYAWSADKRDLAEIQRNQGRGQDCRRESGGHDGDNAARYLRRSPAPPVQPEEVGEPMV